MRKIWNLTMGCCLGLLMGGGVIAAAGPEACGAGGAGCQPMAARAFTAIAVRQFPDATSQFWQAYGYGCARAGVETQRLCRADPARAARRLGLD